MHIYSNLFFSKSFRFCLMVFGLLLLIGQPTVLAQQPAPSERLLGIADSLKQAKNYPEALKLTHKAIGQALNEKSLAFWLAGYRTLASIHMRLDQPLTALAEIEAAMGKMPFEAKNKEEYRALSSLYMYKAWIEKDIGDFPNVKHSLETILPVFEKELRDSFPEHGSFIYLQLGNAYARLGEYEGARQLFEAGIKYSLEQGKPNIAKYNDYGTMYQSRGLDSLALEIFRRGQKHPGQSPYERILLLLNEAESLARLGQTEAARAVNKRAGTQIEKSLKGSSNYHWCKSGWLENEAILAEEKGQLPEALRFLSKAREITASDPDGPDERALAGYTSAMANIFVKRGQVDKALEACAEALNYLLPGGEKQPGDYPIADELKAENMLIRILEIQSECFEKQGNPERAIQAFTLIPIVEAQLRATHDYERSSLQALQESRKRFDKAISLAWEMYANGQDPRFAAMAFSFSEQARGLLLLQSLAQAQAKFKLPPTWRLRETTLINRVAWCQKELASAQENGEEERVDKLEKILFDLKREQGFFLESLRDSFPDYTTLQSSPDPIQASELSSVCLDGQALISYYLTAEDLYVFYYEKNTGLAFRHSDLPDHFREDVTRFVGYLSKVDDASSERMWFQGMAHQLYELLLGPELSGSESRRLMLVPDELLTFIPFEVLFQKNETGNWMKMPYLLRNYSIAYAYSLSLLKLQQEVTRQQRSGLRSFAGFAPNYSASPIGAGTDADVANLMREGVYQLEGTHEELRQAHQLLGGQPFDGPDATEANFKRFAARYRVLLLSMHGFSNEETPGMARLLFGDPGAEPIDGEDNVLYAFELQACKLHADLVVLSACHTGAGKLHRGEGVYSLARAFAAAGVPATIMSLWRLPDKTAPILIGSFFKKLKDGKGKDQALQQAKIAFLSDDANSPYGHPAFWAGVVANGDVSALALNNYPGWWVPGAILILVIGGIIVYRLRQERLRNQNA
jgi:CHAT domain-containing protein/tetratricopeptide (TPR) repeat protein